MQNRIQYGEWLLSGDKFCLVVLCDFITADACICSFTHTRLRDGRACNLIVSKCYSWIGRDILYALLEKVPQDLFHSVYFEL